MDQPTQLTIQSDKLKRVRIDEHPAGVYLARLAPGSRRTMKEALATIALLVNGQSNALAVNWAQLRFQHTQAIRAALAEKYSAATANKMLSALRGTLKAAYLLGQIPPDDYARAIQIERVIGETLPAGRALTAGEIAAILDACTNDPRAKGARDGALIALMRGGGMRRAELCSLRLENYDPVSATFKVLGKRNKERSVPVQIEVADALADWIAVRGNADGPLFCSITKSGHLTRQKLSTTALYKIVNERAQQAGVKSLSPHDFRRTFVSDLLDAGADIATVAKMAGHANVETTKRYDRRGEVVKRKAADLLHVPYRRRLTLIPPSEVKHANSQIAPQKNKKRTRDRVR